MKNNTIPLLFTSLLKCSMVFSSHSVSPPPDGGYLGGNTAEGDNALLSLSSGFYNTAVGLDSLLSVTDGSFCTGIGAGTLLSNTGNENTAIGAGALFSNSTGAGNTADGSFARTRADKSLGFPRWQRPSRGGSAQPSPVQHSIILYRLGHAAMEISILE